MLGAGMAERHPTQAAQALRSVLKGMKDDKGDRGEATRFTGLIRASAMGTPLVLLSRPVWNAGCGDQRRIKI
jgi:hypothetical protein